AVGVTLPRGRLKRRRMTTAPDRDELVVQRRAVAASPEVGQHRDVDPVLVRDECPRRVVQLAPPHHSPAIFRDEARFEVLLRVPAAVPMAPLRAAPTVAGVRRSAYPDDFPAVGWWPGT